MARHKLDLRPEPRSVVIGISCHENDYRLCWALNRNLGISLSRRNEDVPALEGGTGRFAAYDHMDPEHGVVATLLCNRSQGVTLIKEQKEADHFFIFDEQGPLDMEETLAGIRNTEFVLAAFVVDLKRLRSGLELFA